MRKGLWSWWFPNLVVGIVIIVILLYAAKAYLWPHMAA